MLGSAPHRPTPEACGISRARSALGRGYAVVVAADATAAGLPGHHSAELEILARLVGITATVDEIANAGRWPSG